jgi:hypothetical protein
MNNFCIKNDVRKLVVLQTPGLSLAQWQRQLEKDLRQLEEEEDSLRYGEEQKPFSIHEVIRAVPRDAAEFHSPPRPIRVRTHYAFRGPAPPAACGQPFRYGCQVASLPSRLSCACISGRGLPIACDERGRQRSNWLMKQRDYTGRFGRSSTTSPGSQGTASFKQGFQA